MAVVVGELWRGYFFIFLFTFGEECGKKIRTKILSHSNTRFAPVDMMRINMYNINRSKQ